MAQEIIPAFYWDLSDLPQFVKSELDRRTTSIQSSPRYSDSRDFSENKYTHPSVAWVRACSNAVVQYGNEIRSGFTLMATQNMGFKDRYGFNAENSSILGYTADGKSKHYVSEERYKHRPVPGIYSVESKLNGGDGKFRITTIKWKCWSLDQLTYMTPYWLNVGVSVSVEFGWQNFNPLSQMELSDPKKMLEHFYDGRKLIDKVKLSNGNYDASMGVISDFGYDQKDDGSYDCYTVVKNVGGFFSGVYSSGRSTKNSKTGEQKKSEWKKYVEDKMSNEILTDAKNRHSSKKEDLKSQVFYQRSETNLTDRGGRKKDIDFDNNNDNWWMSFGLFIDILNNHMSAFDDASDMPIFKFDIENSIIGAHPNLKSLNGNVLLIPNSTCPDISLDNIPTPSAINSTQSSIDPDLQDANSILNNIKKSFNTNGKSDVQVSRFNMNKIINWWSTKNQSNLSFPSSSDTERSKKNRSGYLKNLYVNVNAIKDLKNVSSFKTMIETLLKQMSVAAGGIWDFKIVPLNPNGDGNGVMTIIDSNYTNFSGGSKESKIYNFEYNNNLCIIRDVGFSVNSTNAISTQTLLGKGTDIVGEVIIPGTDNSIDQTVTLPIGLSVKDRLISGYKDSPIPSKSSDIDDNDKDPSQDRIHSKESPPKRFLYTWSGKTFSLVEHVPSVQNGLIYGGDSNSLRLYAIQPGIELKFKTMGISGIRNLHTFTVDNLPPPYGPDCFFQVKNVEHYLDNGEWNTILTAGLRRRPPTLK